jgi:hypothetical protein
MVVDNNSVDSAPLRYLITRLQPVRVRATVVGIYGSSIHPLSPVRRIDAVSMHLYGAGRRMVRDHFSSAALLPGLSTF